MKHTIVCPQCSSVINLSESFTNKIEADLKQLYEAQILKLNSELLTKNTEIELLKIDQDANVLKIDELQNKLKVQFGMIEKLVRNEK